jgi:hypothetical protein
VARSTATEVTAMGFVRIRVSGDDQTRYIALYAYVKGRQRSAGTYATEAQAMRASQKAEDRSAKADSARR